MIQQLREAFPYDSSPTYLIFDRDAIFNAAAVDFIKAMGNTPVKTSYRSPWVERALDGIEVRVDPARL